jgi:hypothetical protein
VDHPNARRGSTGRARGAWFQSSQSAPGGEARGQREEEKGRREEIKGKRSEEKGKKRDPILWLWPVRSFWPLSFVLWIRHP